MYKALLSVILLLSFLSATAAELNCLCFEDTVVENSSVEKASVHHDQTEDSAEHRDHCKHICTQCHFAAVVPRIFKFKPDSVSADLTFSVQKNSPVTISNLIYRPPIA